MLLDAKHKPWLYWTTALAFLSLAVYFAADRFLPGGVTGGTTVGLWYGIVGTALMIYAGLLSGLRRVPAWSWLGARKTWLRGHIWLGLLSVVMILCHSGFRLGGLLEQVLWLVFGLTIVTGIVGLVLQQFLPRWLTLRVPSEAPYEQLPHLCNMLRRRGDDVLTAVFKSTAIASQASIMVSQLGMGAKIQLQEFYEKQIRPFLNETYPRSSLLANTLQAQAAFSRLRSLPGLVDVKERVTELEVLCDERRQLAVQERLHFWLHAWLLIHIPLSVAMYVIALLHIVTALYY